MPVPTGGPTPGYQPESVVHGRLIRQAYRLAAKQVQVLGTKVRELEQVMDRLRDRTYVPTMTQVYNQVPPRWQVVWNALKDAERTITDLLSFYV